jgi:branched-chain amino acid transport system substrate-binding protein
MLRKMPTTATFLWVAACILALSASGAGAAEKVKLGMLATLSGPNAVIGTQVRDGFNLALEEAGGKLGGLPTELIVIDDQQKPDVARQAANKLIESDKIDVLLGPLFSSVLNAVLPVANQAKLPMIGLSGAPSSVAGADCSPYFFSSSWQGDTLAEAIGIALQEKNIKKLYLMVPNFPGGKEVVAGVKRYFKGNIVGEVYTPLSQLDFSAELAQLRSAAPDAAFVFYPGGLGIQFIKQYAQAGLKQTIPLYTAYTIDASTLPAMGDDALGIETAEFWGPSIDNEANRKFVESFRRKYNYSASSYAVQGYDAGRLLDSAIRRVKGKVEDRQVMLAALKAADFASVRGAFKYNNNQFPIQDLYVGQITKGNDGTPTMRLGRKVLTNHPDPYAAKCPLR